MFGTSPRRSAKKRKIHWNHRCEENTTWYWSNMAYYFFFFCLQALERFIWAARVVHVLVSSCMRWRRYWHSFKITVRNEFSVFFLFRQVDQVVFVILAVWFWFALNLNRWGNSRFFHASWLFNSVCFQVVFPIRLWNVFPAIREEEVSFQICVNYMTWNWTDK